MAGSFQPNAIHESATQMQSDGIHSQSKSFVDNSYANMPVSAANMGLNEVMRMQQGLRGSCLRDLQDFQTLPSLPFSVGYPPQNAYLFADNGYGLGGGGRTVYIKEEKGEDNSSPTMQQQRPLSSSGTTGSHNRNHHSHHTSHHHHHHHHRPQQPAPSLPPPRPSSDGCGSESSPLGAAPFSPGGDRDKSGGRSGGDYDGGRRGLMGGDKSGLPSLMVVTVPPSYSDGPGSMGHPSPPVGGGGGTLSSSSSEVMSASATNHHHQHHHHQQVLKYAPNGDALLSASAINYGDGAAMLQDDEDEGFDVNVGNSLGSLDDGILSGNLSVGGGSVTGGAPTSFDLFEGEGEHDAYLEGDQELQLSPPPPPPPPGAHNFVSSGGNDVFRRGGVGGSTGLGSMSSVGSVNIKLEDDGSGGRPRDNHKLSVDGLSGDGGGGGKSKTARPTKAISPNRAGTQTCPVCCKAFSNSSALAKHKLTHSDERKYVCQICTKAFKRQDHLNGHLLTHMNKKPYECRVDGCGKSYCDARSLRRHTENHHSNGSASANSAGAQLQSAAAAAAAVAAIAVQINSSAGSATSTTTTTATRTVLPPFSSASSKVDSSSGGTGGGGPTSFLASALQQSNRIRYAPALNSVVTSSSASTALPAPVMAAPMYTSACSPSLAASASSNESSGGTSASSAAGHLQLLAFQQQEQQQQLGGGSGQGSPLSWQQQPSNSANIVYLNGPNGGQQPMYADERATPVRLLARPSSNDGCGPAPPLPPPPPPPAHSSAPAEVVDGYLGQQKVPVVAHHQRNPSPTLLAQQLAKLPAHIGQDAVSGSVGLRQMPLSSLFSQGNLLQTVGVPPHPLTLDINQAIQQWAQPTSYAVTGSNNTNNIVINNISLGSNPKPVECNICQRKFKNIPALNGHMRLHGGYLKKDVDGTRRSDKKSSDTGGNGGNGSGGSGNGSQSHHPPLQTASMSIRALIEEKIIQRRIINPPANLSPHHPSSSLLPPSLLTSQPPPPLQPPPHSHQQLTVPHHHRSSPSERLVYAAPTMPAPSTSMSGSGGSPADQMVSTYGDSSSAACLNDPEQSHLDLRLGLAQHHHQQQQHQGQQQQHHHQPQNLTLQRPGDHQRHRQEQQHLHHVQQDEQRLQHEQILQQHEQRLQHEQQQLEQQQQQQQQQLHRVLGHLQQQGSIRSPPLPPLPPPPPPDHMAHQHHHHHHHHHQHSLQQQQHHHHDVMHDERDDDDGSLMDVDSYGGSGGAGGGGGMEEGGDSDAQSDMQRQIEIIKQGLMAHQPVLEKFRRHSDSDHFLSAPRRSLAAGITNADSLLVDYVQRRVAALGAGGGRQRTQRTGSDPGEFTFGQFVSEAFPGSLVEELDDGDDEAGCPVTDDDVMDDDVMDADVMDGGLPPMSEDDPFLPPSNSDMIDFESLSSTLPNDEDNDHHSRHHHHVKSEDDVTSMLVAVDAACEAAAAASSAAMQVDDADDVSGMYVDESLASVVDVTGVTVDDVPIDLPDEMPEEMPAPPTVIATTASFAPLLPVVVTTSAVATPLPPPATGVVISRIRVENIGGGGGNGGGGNQDDDDVFLSPTSIPTSPIRAKKKKHRPEPLYIPPQVSTCGFQSRLRSPRLWDPTGSSGGGGGGGSGSQSVGVVSTGGHGMGSHGIGGHKKLMSPPPYTPPPMLSPVRCGPGLFWQVLSGSGSLTPKSAPLTPGRLSLSMANDYAVAQEEEVDYCEVPETDIQPHVNIGWQYQARLPPYCPDQRGYNPQIDDITWDPKVEENITEKESGIYPLLVSLLRTNFVEALSNYFFRILQFTRKLPKEVVYHSMYLQFACCAAIPGGGRNKEYALHMLCMCKGNIQEAMIKLMDPAPKLPKFHPLLTYAYAENDKWTVEEFETYQQALMNYDKDFFSISQEVKTKSVKQCIQFYYLWKKICPDEYKRLRTVRRKRELDGTQYNLRSKLEGEAADGEASSTPKSEDVAPSPGKSNDSVGDRFICDQPDCFASFASRMALNGHIRIHGNAVAKGSSGSTNGNGNRSQSPAAPSGADDSAANQSYGHGAASAATYRGSAAKVSTVEFPCKICGKVFKKVKSRSAHMKSHRPMDHDRNKFHEKVL